MYRLVFTREFDRTFGKVRDPVDKKRILTRVMELKTNPHLGRMLAGIADESYGRLYRLRVGKYRIIYAVLSDRVEIILLTVGHRKNVYQK